MKHKLIFHLLICAALCTAFYTQSISAQVDFGELFYLRHVDSSYQYIRLSQSEKQVYTFPPETCVGLSPQGTYLLETPRAGTELTIRRFDTQAILVKTPWQPDWEPCAARWYSESKFGLRQAGTTDQFYAFDFSNDTLVATTPQKPTPQPPFTLPNRVVDSETFNLPSPNTNVILYERCIETVQVRSESRCRQTDLVIYDVEQRADIQVLADADTSVQAVWSPDGRYLAFAHLQKPNLPYNLSIYDVKARRYLDTNFLFANFPIDWHISPNWSVGGERLSFWVLGALGQDKPYVPSDRTLVFYDTATEQFTIATQIYPIPVQGNIGLWSPGGKAFAFVDLNQNLVYVDASTGGMTVLDDHVSQLMLWR